MPVKQRRRKARAFDEYHREQLVCGPDSSLLAGVGYCEGTPAHFQFLSEADRAVVLAAMEADWKIHGPELMRAQRADSSASLPWAAMQFGLPGEDQCQ